MNCPDHGPQDTARSNCPICGRTEGENSHSKTPILMPKLVHKDLQERDVGSSQVHTYTSLIPDDQQADVGVVAGQKGRLDARIRSCGVRKHVVATRVIAWLTWPWRLLLCKTIGHDWTCKVEQGIKATPEELPEPGDTSVDVVRKFKKYAEMRCARCGKVSDISKRWQEMLD